MRIITLVKFIPDIENMSYDGETPREKSRMVLNPEDGCALALAMQLKERVPGTTIQVVSMTPPNGRPLMEDLLRLGIDRGTLLTDAAFIGSDSLATSHTLGKFLLEEDFDLLLTGTHALDGDTSHVPAQLGRLLGICQLSNVLKLELSLGLSFVRAEVEDEEAFTTYELDLPSIISVSRNSGYKLPFIKYENLDLDVSEKLEILSREDLGLTDEETGQKGSPTKVVRSFRKEMPLRDRVLLKNDEASMDILYGFLVEKGFLV